MLRLARINGVPPTPQIEFVYGFSIWWNELRDVFPKSWWTIHTPGHYLLVEVHTPTGMLTSIECPLLGTVKPHDSTLWTCADVREGPPVFEPTLTPWKKCPEPGVEGFDFDYSPTEVRLHWGSAVRAVRSGRCMFGLNGADELVSVGLIEMTGAEFGKLRLQVGESLRGVPVSHLQDWQLTALLEVGREQLDAPWYPGPKATDPNFIAMTGRVHELEIEIERRRGSR
jgi:hypothetical protein